MTGNELRVYTERWRAYAQVALTLGKNIKRLRKEAGLTHQGEFAAMVGVPQSRLSDWENDRYESIELSNLLKIARTLKVSVDDLLVGLDREYDLLRHSGDQQSGLQNGGRSNVIPPSPRISELESERDALKAALGQIHHVALQLIEIAAAGEQGSETVRPAASGRRRDRKTG